MVSNESLKFAIYLAVAAKQEATSAIIILGSQIMFPSN